MTPKTRTVHGIGVSIKDRLDQFGVVLRVILQIRILDDGNVPGDVLKACSQRCAFASINGVVEHVHLLIVRPLNLFEYFAGAVRRTIIYEKNLFFHTDVNGFDLPENLLQGRNLVVDWDNNR